MQSFTLLLLSRAFITVCENPLIQSYFGKEGRTGRGNGMYPIIYVRLIAALSVHLRSSIAPPLCFPPLSLHPDGGMQGTKRKKAFPFKAAL